MGSVYKAIQLSMDRVVALKVIGREHIRDPAARDRFLREARAAGKVNHPNVILCHDAGQDGNVLYQAMELVTGGDVDQARKAAGGSLSQRRSLEIIRDSALGLQAIHDVGLLHRDIKPGNIFLADGGFAKLADLGLARLQSGDDQMTSTGSSVGTPAFMSPEQADGAPDLDIRSDIYALGATLFCLVTGRPPYTGNSAWAVVAAVIKEPFPDPLQVTPTLHPGIADLILTACAKDREERYVLPRDLAQACMDLLKDPKVPGVSVAAVPAVAVNTPPGERSAPKVRKPSPTRPLRLVRVRGALRRHGMVLGVAALVLLGGGAAAMTVRRPAVTEVTDGTPTVPAPSTRPANDPTPPSSSATQALPELAPKRTPPKVVVAPAPSMAGDWLAVLRERGRPIHCVLQIQPEGVLLSPAATAPDKFRHVMTPLVLPDEYDLEFTWFDRTAMPRAEVGLQFSYHGQRTVFMVGGNGQQMRLGTVSMPLPEALKSTDRPVTGRLLVRTNGIEARVDGCTALRCPATATSVGDVPAQGFAVVVHPSRTGILLTRLRQQPARDPITFPVVKPAKP